MMPAILSATLRFALNNNTKHLTKKRLLEITVFFFSHLSENNYF